ncbi:serine/threonine protein kinase, partial [Enterococcus faecium]
YAKGSLKKLMSTRHLTVREIVVIGCQVASGLHNVHSKGLIHFDIKPDNILFSDRGEALLSDFGLTRPFNRSGHAEPFGLYGRMVPPEAYK